MSLEIVFYKKLKKEINISGKKIILRVEYTNEEMSPYNLYMESVELGINIHRWTTNLYEVPTILQEMKGNVENTIAEGNTINGNIQDLTSYFNEL